MQNGKTINKIGLLYSYVTILFISSKLLLLIQLPVHSRMKTKKKYCELSTFHLISYSYDMLYRTNKAQDKLIKKTFSYICIYFEKLGSSRIFVCAANDDEHKKIWPIQSIICDLNVSQASANCL